MDRIVCIDPKSTYYGLNDTGQLFPALIKEIAKTKHLTRVRRRMRKVRLNSLRRAPGSVPLPPIEDT